MIYIIKHVGNKWEVWSEDGKKKLGEHNTEEEAKAQLKAIEANKHKNMEIEGVEFDFEDLQTIKDVEIFAVGTWHGANSPKEGDTYTLEDLNSMVEAFNNGVMEPNIKITHGPDKEQVDVGRVNNLRVIGKKLVGDFINIPKALYELMKRGLFARRSAEVMWNLKDKAGKVWSRVLKAVALLAPGQYPAVTTIADGYKFEGIYCYEYREDEDTDIIGFYFEPPQSGDAPEGVKSILRDVYNSCRSTWVKDHPGDRENAGNKRMCSQTAWSAVEKAGWHKDGSGKWTKTTKQEEERKKMALDDLIKKYGAKDEDDLEIILDSKLKEGTEAKKKVSEFEKVTKENAQKGIKDFIEEMKKEGKILPKEEEGIKQNFESLLDKEDQKGIDNLKTFIRGIGKKVELDEKSRDTKDHKSYDTTKKPADEVDRLAKEYVTEGKAKDYRAGVDMVSINHPELWTTYIKQ